MNPPIVIKVTSTQELEQALIERYEYRVEVAFTQGPFIVCVLRKPDPSFKLDWSTQPLPEVGANSITVAAPKKPKR